MSTETCWACRGCGDDGYGNWSSCRECGGQGVLHDRPRTDPEEYTARVKRWERRMEEARDEAETAYRQHLESLGGDAA